MNYYPPDGEGASLDSVTASKLFESLGNPDGHTGNTSGRHPLMHRTETIDYAIVLSGEITMVLDDSEVVLRAGDVVVQCGTNHAWANRSNSPATVLFVLLSGVYDEDLAKLLRESEASPR
jgi:mannose-6-phosphate isomerase-like protein (cupin superfamily)